MEMDVVVEDKSGDQDSCQKEDNSFKGKENSLKRKDGSFKELNDKSKQTEHSSEETISVNVGAQVTRLNETIAKEDVSNAKAAIKEKQLSPAASRHTSCTKAAVAADKDSGKLFEGRPKSMPEPVAFATQLPKAANIEKEAKEVEDGSEERRWDQDLPPNPRRFSDIGELDDDLQDVKKVVTDRRHKIILVIRLESTSTDRKRYLIIVSCPTNSRSKSTGQMRSESSSMQCRRTVVSTKHFSVPSQSASMTTEDADFCLLGVDVIHHREEGGIVDDSSTVSHSSDGVSTVSQSVSRVSQSVSTVSQSVSTVSRSVSIGFVLALQWGTKVSLDGDGGFSVLHLATQHVFKPVSVQALWTVIQILHLITGKLKPKRHSVCLGEVDWLSGYLARISSPESCINEWNALPDVQVRRSLTKDELSRLSADELDLETKKCLIKSKLREIMRNVDLDSITVKAIRSRLEEDLQQNLNQYKAFIDEEILVTLRQMDPASCIFDFLYLGSAWNASNLEELNSNGVTHILNITKEIDNFFPSIFKYLNIREYDVEEADLMKYWDQTYNFIKECLSSGGKVLVHCKMGISRSASTVVAFAMKYFQWSMVESLEHVKSRRGIIDPNTGFRRQLCVYEGILDASKKSIAFRKHRSKSESSADRDLPRKEREDADKRVPPNRAFSCRIQGSAVSPAVSEARKQTTANNNQQQHKQNIKEFLLPNCDKFTAARECGGVSTDSDASSADVNKREREDPVVCHCYSDFALYINSKQVRSSAIEEPRQLRSSTNNLVEATNLQVRLNPDCPATSHIDQCTCNLELELKVPESPVSVSTSPPTSQETDLILRNLGNFPIHIRQRIQHHNKDDRKIDLFDPHNTHNEADDVGEELGVVDGDDGEQDENNKNHALCLDTSGAEELSVKTLADMYEFKLGENPAKPPLPTRQTSGGTKILEAKIGEISKKLSLPQVSQC